MQSAQIKLHVSLINHVSLIDIKINPYSSLVTNMLQFIEVKMMRQMIYHVCNVIQNLVIN